MKIQALNALAEIRNTLRAVDNQTANTLVDEFNKVAEALGAGKDWMVFAQPGSVLARGKSGWKDQ